MATPKKNKSSRVTIPIRAYPVLPLRDIVVFPFMIVPLFVGRSKSIAALENAVQDDGMVFLMAQKNTSDENPDPADLYEVGTVAKVLQMLKLPDGTVKVLVEGLGRSHAIEFLDNPEFLQAVAEPLTSDMGDKKEITSLSAGMKPISWLYFFPFVINHSQIAG